MLHVSVVLICSLFGMTAVAMANPLPDAPVYIGKSVAGSVLNTQTCPPGYRPCGSGCCPT